MASILAGELLELLGAGAAEDIGLTAKEGSLLSGVDPLAVAALGAPILTDVIQAIRGEKPHDPEANSRVRDIIRRQRTIGGRGIQTPGRGLGFHDPPDIVQTGLRRRGTTRPPPEAEGPESLEPIEIVVEKPRETRRTVGQEGGRTVLIDPETGEESMERRPTAPRLRRGIRGSTKIGGAIGATAATGVAIGAGLVDVAPRKTTQIKLPDPTGPETMPKPIHGGRTKPPPNIVRNIVQPTQEEVTRVAAVSGLPAPPPAGLTGRPTIQPGHYRVPRRGVYNYERWARLAYANAQTLIV
jgi:hypothetical protein